MAIHTTAAQQKQPTLHSTQSQRVIHHPPPLQRVQPKIVAAHLEHYLFVRSIRSDPILLNCTRYYCK